MLDDRRSRPSASAAGIKLPCVYHGDGQACRSPGAYEDNLRSNRRMSTGAGSGGYGRSRATLSGAIVVERLPAQRHFERRGILASREVALAGGAAPSSQ